MSVTDQATADYAHEQERRAALDRDWEALWAEYEQPTPQRTAAKRCAQCINWSPERLLHLANGNNQPLPGSCGIRADGELPQMSQEYAEHCSFYEVEEPF